MIREDKKEKKIHFSEHLFSFILLPLIIVVGIISYERFMMQKDYLVEYEAECDPVEQNCFVNCEEDECYFFSEIQKYAPDLYAQCGNDITDCEAANICLPEDTNCSIIYCNEENETDNLVCEAISTKTEMQNLEVENIDNI